jgi:hypothetical protein
MRWPSSWVLDVFAMRHTSHGAATPLNPTPERLRRYKHHLPTTEEVTIS